uniref:Uncharacterized protein n=1 Tax=Anguilla anguilla TaxID=7936 RepID=A0A0E9T0L5_ANGAN
MYLKFPLNPDSNHFFPSRNLKG